MKKKKTINIFICILTLCFFILLGRGLYADSLIHAQNKKDYDNWSNSNKYFTSYSSSSQIISSLKEKLSNKEDIKLLVLGDDYILKNNSWAEDICELIKSKYGSQVNLVYLDVNTNNISDGIKILNENSDTNNFDLALISFGLYDCINNTSTDEFAQSYTNLLSNLKMKNYRCSIISIIPPIINDNSDYYSLVKSLCCLNNINFVNPFYSGQNANILFENNTPTEKGYEYLTSCLENIINRQIE